MNKTFSLLFYVRKSKKLANGTAPIYLRITIDGKAKEMTTKRHIEPERWNSTAQKVNGNTEEVKALNAYLKTLEQEVYETQHQLLKDKTTVTTEGLKNKLMGIDTRKKYLVPIFQDHNNKMEALLNEEFAPGTLERYKTSLKHTQEFIMWKYKVSDIDIAEIDHSFITEYEFYLRSERKCSNNTTLKYIKNFGKIIRICIANGWIDKNPFANFKVKLKEIERVFLSKEELDAVVTKEFSTKRLGQIRDVFVFSCYTGLAYADVKKLDKSQIAIGIDGEKWIYTNRQKTDTRSNIPILPVAQAILDKYKDDITCINSNKLLPVLSNQKMNEYLKEIATLCEIDKDFTYHTARHTFATTVTLTNGVPIESVSKMLGHKDLKTTQHYAKILDSKVSGDMKLLREKFSLESLNLKKISSL